MPIHMKSQRKRQVTWCTLPHYKDVWRHDKLSTPLKVRKGMSITWLVHQSSSSLTLSKKQKYKTGQKHWRKKKVRVPCCSTCMTMYSCESILKGYSINILISFSFCFSFFNTVNKPMMKKDQRHEVNKYPVNLWRQSRSRWRELGGDTRML